MAYKAVVYRIHHHPVPGLDNLVAGECGGYQVLVGKDTPQEALGLFFETDGQLSEEFAQANDLIRRKNEDGTYAGGMFEANRRVKSIKLKGHRSDGFWIPIESLYKVSDNVEKTQDQIDYIKEGDQLDTWNGVPICTKYFTPKTHQQRQGEAKQRREVAMFRKHVETDPFLKNLHMIVPGSIVTISEKLHGTSHRYGHVLATVPITHRGIKALALRIFGATLCKRWFGIHTEETKWMYLNGTRNTILEENGVDGFYHDSFRTSCTRQLEGRLYPGEILYGEIVGYTNGGTPIMAQQDTTKLKDKKVSKQFGNLVTYSYGCEPGECKFYVYRITRALEGSNGCVDVPPKQMLDRCRELGLNYVPQLDCILIPDTPEVSDTTVDFVVDVVERFVNGDGSETKPSRICGDNPIEGVVVRVDHHQYGTTFLKHKSHTFGLLEGYLKDNDDYVDQEEIS